MQLKEILRGLETRQFSMIASALKQRNFDVVSNGWTATAARLEALAAADPKKDLAKELLEVYMGNMLYCQKAVLLWVVKKDVARQICTVLPDFIDSASPYLTKYPLPLDLESLQTVKQFGVPTGFHVDGEISTLVFASKREKTEEELLPLEEMPNALRKAGFTQFYGKKTKVFPVFDSITITPSTGLIEMRLDHGKILSEKDVVAFRSSLVKRFNQLVKDNLGFEQVLGAAVNLEPALAPLYQGKAWVVYQINHQNDAGYSNSNRGRHRTDDVRSDTYHTTGERAVGNIDLWQLTASFKSSYRTTAPMLVLEGSSSMLSSLVPFMDIARIIDCATTEEYRQVFTALLECVGLVKVKKNATS